MQTNIKFLSMMGLDFARVEKIVGTGENADIQDLLFFTQCFPVIPFSSLSNDNILDLPKLKAFADDKIKVTDKN